MSYHSTIIQNENKAENVKLNDDIKLSQIFGHKFKKTDFFNYDSKIRHSIVMNIDKDFANYGDRQMSQFHALSKRIKFCKSVLTCA